MPENQQQEDTQAPERRPGPTTLEKGLEASLERLAEMRKSHPGQPEPNMGQVVPFGGRLLSAPKPTISKEQLAAQLLRLDVVYPSSPRDPSEITLRYQVFFDILKNLTLSDLTMACDRYLRSSERFGPTPGQLLALAKL